MLLYKIKNVSNINGNYQPIIIADNLAKEQILNVIDKSSHMT